MDNQRFWVFVKISFMMLKEVHTVVVPIQRTSMIGAFRLLSKHIKVYQAYSCIDSNQLPIIDWVVYFPILGVRPYILWLIVPLLPVVSYSLFEPFFCHWDFNWSNNKKWRHELSSALGFMDLDMCRLEDRPAVHMMKVHLILRQVVKLVCVGIPSCETVKEFFDAIR